MQARPDMDIEQQMARPRQHVIRKDPEQAHSNAPDHSLVKQRNNVSEVLRAGQGKLEQINQGGNKQCQHHARYAVGNRDDGRDRKLDPVQIKKTGRAFFISPTGIIN